MITAGNGGDAITEASLSVGDTEAIALGNGNNSVTLGATVDSAAPVVKPAVHAAALSQVLADGNVEIANDLIVLLGAGNSSFTATNVQIGDTALVLGGLGFRFGFNPAANPSARQPQCRRRGVCKSLGRASRRNIWPQQHRHHHAHWRDCAKGVGIFTGVKDTDIVNIRGPPSPTSALAWARAPEACRSVPPRPVIPPPSSG